ncbi:MAG: hypothetical protein U0Q18_37405 [Bryobacteraceae bacterium]
MRYAPGSIAVSADADIPVLRAVHRAGHLTVHQLYSALYGAREKRLWDGLAWRVGRLVRTGLLDRAEVVGLKGAVLSLGTDGELCLQGHDSSLVDRGRRMRGGNKRHQIWHDVELFEIQLALRRAGVVTTWEAECEYGRPTITPRTATPKTTTSGVSMAAGAESSPSNTSGRRNHRWSTSGLRRDRA